MGASKEESAKQMMKNKNVAGGQLAQLSKDPPTGFYRDGYCRTGPEDKGNHSIGATVNQEFLDFTNSKGNNLTKAGVKDGMRWCLCSTRWREAFDAAQKGTLSKSAVPKVHLHASHESALKDVKYSDLKQYAAQAEAQNELANRKQGYENPEKPGGVSKDSKEISGNSETTGGVGVDLPKGK
ncbi:hypothetical protein LTR84_011110 [Exophiala bonariae]|uniref:Uncharacterized protein n=1 Tax=Exophiala bonariae TaxID=1690606 RepID=A0AAV9NKP1_9EURO|nr:hypothetical protein LTR84_011110 [Exophiala bonariae]